MVIAGNAAAVARAIEAAKARGAKRAVPLPVSVPSHSRLMVGAARAARASGSRASTVRMPDVPAVYTVDVQTHASPDGIRRALEEQLYKPVRWAGDRARHAGERRDAPSSSAGPGKVLTSLNSASSGGPTSTMLAVEDPDATGRRRWPRAGRSSMTELGNELALVTGASRGIGRAIALELGRRGATVIGTATSAAGAQAIDEALAAAGVQGRGVVLDVADAAAVDACLKDVEARDGTPSILVNNAGVTRDGLLLRMSAEDWQVVIETDLSAVYRTCKAVLRGMMKARRGRIINIASVVGVMGNAGQANYAAAKAGMIGFSKSLAREVGSRGITVNVVAPGFIVTDMTDALGEAPATALLRPGAARPARLAGGHRARGGVPGLAAGGLHHRRDAACQWWHVHDLERVSGSLDRIPPLNLEYAPHAGRPRAERRQAPFSTEDSEDNEQYRTAREGDRCRAAGGQGRRSDQRFVLRRRPRRRLARHRRAGHGARGRVRDGDPGRGRREDHHRPAGDRLHQRASQPGLTGPAPHRHGRRSRRTSPCPARGTQLDEAQSRRHRTWHRFPARQHGRVRLGRHLQRPQRHRARSPGSTPPPSRCTSAARSSGFNAEDYMSPKDVRKFDPFVPFGVARGRAGVPGLRARGRPRRTRARIGVAMGAGIGGLSTIEENTAKWLEAQSPRKISPFFIPGSIINAASGQVSIHFGMRGPNLALVTACTTSTHSIGIAARTHPVR